jgi:hypothetical protein
MAHDLSAAEAGEPITRPPRSATRCRTTIQQLGEGAVQAVCSCGWRSPVFGAGKRTGTMNPLQHATDAAYLHE